MGRRPKELDAEIQEEAKPVKHRRARFFLLDVLPEFDTEFDTEAIAILDARERTPNQQTVYLCKVVKSITKRIEEKVRVEVK